MTQIMSCKGDVIHKIKGGWEIQNLFEVLLTVFTGMLKSPDVVCSEGKDTRDTVSDWNSVKKVGK